MSTEANKQVALDLFKAIEDADEARLNALLDDSLEWWVIGKNAMGGVKTKEMLVTAIRDALWTSMEGPAAISFDTLTAEDDRVAMIGHGHMRTKGGVPYENTYNFLLWVRNGKVVKAREYFDTQLVVNVFGL